MAEIYAWADDEYFAKLPGVRAKLAETAKAGAARAGAILDAHHYRGHARIEVSHGELDWFVALDDTRGQHAAAAIEFGRRGGKRGTSSGIHALRSAF
jgi:hypothetical protein